MPLWNIFVCLFDMLVVMNIFVMSFENNGKNLAERRNLLLAFTGSKSWCVFPLLLITLCWIMSYFDNFMHYESIYFVFSWKFGLKTPCWHAGKHVDQILFENMFPTLIWTIISTNMRPLLKRILILGENLGYNPPCVEC